MTMISRRKAIGAAGAGALLLGASAAGAKEEKLYGDIAWTKTCDVLVVGSGYAGLCAAIEAKNAGADVILIESASAPTKAKAPPRFARSLPLSTARRLKPMRSRFAANTPSSF